ncbi:DNA/RNA polymerase [Artomyces pyxidatus]|uniref:DNA/RNA polymerase n=1 Tax=Artomyces pyxidatus TaxID=48021 RepID=A0ACB8T4C1_9AGAM|nr:DNA/RNA polymerase [Artomyces pyxidatus]
MGSFLQTRTPFTVLPTPLPQDQQSSADNAFFTDSSTCDLLAVMDACLHNAYDVPRAKEIFEEMRTKKNSDLHPRLYNTFLQAYLQLATTNEPHKKALWMEDFWDLFDVMESGSEAVNPTAGTYTLALLAWMRFSAEDSPTIVPGITQTTPTDLLRSVIDRQLSVTMVVSDRSIPSSEEAGKMIQLLSKAAVQLNLSKVVTELGQAEALGSRMDSVDSIPDVRPVTVQKKITNEDGTVSDSEESEIPFNLEVLRKHLAQVSLARRVLTDDVAARQKLLEESVYDVAVERLRRQAEIFQELGIDNKGYREPDLQQWLWDWHQKLQARLKEDIALVVQEENQPVPNKQATRIGPFVSLIKPEKLSLIAILEIMRMQGTGGVSEGMKTARALIVVGRAVEAEYKAEMCRKNNIAIPTNLGRAADKGYFSRLSYQDLHARRVTARKYMEDAEEWTSDWTQVVRVRVGSFLVDRLMEVAKVTRTATHKVTGELVTEEQPAFSHSYEYLRGYKLGVIKINPTVSERLAKDGLRETLHPRHLPMLVKPRPWLNYNEGGYMYNPSAAMRFKDSQEQQAYLKHASAQGNVELVFAGLDVLGSTPWQVNRRIFDVVLQVWNAGHRLGKLPPAVYDQPEPEKPEDMDTDPKARTVYLTRQRVWLQNKANNHSERCSVNYKIEIARAFLGDTIYLPHNLDFRGRAYPIPPHLNHIGDDLSRGLLLFAEAKPLGERGLRWLKIHLANLYGFDKATFDERVAFVHERLDEVYDSADHPLDGRGWWQKADDPWQCLAACMELKAALESPDPLAYECCFPVHQDGTCNGLQHYAALGGDARGAKQVNLDSADRPSDVYTYVANMVEKRILDDLEKGGNTKEVMTTVYGVTFIGAREQIERQLKDRGDVPYEDTFYASAYLAKKVLQCIGDLFQGAQDIMNWLTLSARLIAKSVPGDRVTDAMAFDTSRRGRAVTTLPTTRLRKEQMTAVVWTTPLGLPIVQPYRKTKRKQIMTSLQTVYISDPNAPAEVNAQKQASAFPPNFIHSLDATHMLLTALECRTQGLTFASVHDSYWTHPSSIDQMSEIIRDTFIALHSSDVLSRLESEFRERYKGYKVPLVSLQTNQMLRQLGADTFADAVVSVDDVTAEAAPSAGDFVPSTDWVEDEEDADDRMTEKEPKGSLRSTRRRPKVAQADGVGAGDEDQDDKVYQMPPNVLKGKFVNLTDLLPPLPPKGEFDVNKIKSSLYFFS